MTKGEALWDFFLELLEYMLSAPWRSLDERMILEAIVPATGRKSSSVGQNGANTQREQREAEP